MTSRKQRLFLRTSFSVAVLAAGIVASGPARAQSDPFIGEIMLVPYNFCPRGWAEAAGQILQISQNTALFSLLGTNYGGDGRVTFALPDLRGRVPVGVGMGPGLSEIELGDQGGQETAQLTTNQLPAHTHSATTQVTLRASDADGNSADPTGRVLARANKDKSSGSGKSAAANTSIYNGGPSNVDIGATAATAQTTVGSAGSGQAFSVVDPYLGLRYCIALVGIFPSQN